jgi:hypothetical protein
MEIQFNTDNNIKVSNELRVSLTSLISNELSRFNDHITRLEVHLSDEDGHKDGQNDKRCMIEARLRAIVGLRYRFKPETTGRTAEIRVRLNKRQ